MRRIWLCFFLLTLLLGSEAYSQAPRPELRIIQPANGSVMPQKFSVKGTAKNLGQNKILVFVFAPVAKKWFFQDVATLNSDGSWEANIVVGRPEDVNYDFQIVATVMRDVPQGLLEVAGDRFPLPSTLGQSQSVLVRRGR